MLTRRTFIFVSSASFIIAGFIFAGLLTWPQGASSREQFSATAERLPGLQRRATVVRDTDGVPHVTASNDHDAYFMMGYLHAQDRFFQMDFARRQGSGTLGELFGAGPEDEILGSDIVLRTFGVARSAERSLTAYSPEAIALIRAYADGVNAWLDNNPLPPEYRLLEITQVPRWRPVDSLIVSKLISFQLTFDISDLRNTTLLSGYQGVGGAAGFDGTKLYFEDIFRFAPFDTAVINPQSPAPTSLASGESGSPSLRSQVVENARQVQELIGPDVIEAANNFVERYSRNPLFNRLESGTGSNWYVVAGSKTDTGNAMLANDPHLGLGTPSTFYEIHLEVDSHSSPMNVYGVSFSGVPGVVLGQNERISWGGANAFLDVTDFYVERLAISDGLPVATNYKGQPEPLVVIPETFKLNQVQNGAADDLIVIPPGSERNGEIVPPATFIVPRRNNGPLIPGVRPAGPATAISVQYAGASASRDLEGIFALARARNLTEFKRAIRLLETGPLAYAYADVDGNIATFLSGSVPLREDLRAGTVDGLPPFFIRDGSGFLRNEWIPKTGTGPGFNYESLPFEEMPQTVNPAQGFLVGANNDPVGVSLDNNPLNDVGDYGIYYLSSVFNAGFRAAKITDLINQQLDNRWGSRKVSFQEMQSIQGNVQLYDAEVLTPHIVRAFERARRSGAPADLAALANDAAVREAVKRLSNWDFSSPTGIYKGYDASDVLGIRLPPSSHEVSNSVATTIYTVWRTQILANTITATLQRVGLGGGQPDAGRMLVDLRFLLDNFATNQGVGSSGLDFFEIPGVDATPEIRRDAIILKSLKEALNLLASDQFASVFGGSTNQNEYRWGKLHRITFSHPFGPLAPQFSIPTAGNFEDLSPTLPGIATDGGFETIDNAPFVTLVALPGSYMFGVGPARRYVGELRDCGGLRSVQIIPGGESGVAGNRFYSNQLSFWLTNDYHRVLFTTDEINSKRFSKADYWPGS